MAIEKKFSLNFPYIELAGKEQLTCGAHFDRETMELVSDNSPEFSEFVAYGDITIEEGFVELERRISDRLQKAHKIDPTLTAVFLIMPFAEYSITTWTKEIAYFYVWLVKLAIVKNPIITNKKEDLK